MTNRKTNVALFFLAVFMTSTASASTLEVCPSGCTYSTIQSAIDAAIDGDTVLVNDGTYVENINFLGKAITVKSVNGKEKTIIDGNQKGSVVIFKDGNASTLNGLGIINGNALEGGGIYCNNSSLTITNCNIKNNLSIDYGGGVYCKNAVLMVIDSTINNNFAEGHNAGHGGGFYIKDSSTEIFNCMVYENITSRGAAGFFFDNAHPSIISGCSINNNKAGHDGGGIFCGSTSLKIINSKINNNEASWHGGGLYFYSYYESSPTITNCIIDNNIAYQNGGGIYCYREAKPFFSNCTITGNWSNKDGGGIYCDYYYPSSPTVLNSILWDNAAGNNANEIFLGGNSLVDISYSDIKGSWPGEGNINTDPLFVDPDNSDYRLQPKSPCIDTGTNTEGVPLNDIEGTQRPKGDDHDMGAFEFFCTTNMDCDDKNDCTIDTCIQINNQCIYSKLEEICNDNIDNDCDGQTDEDCHITEFSADINLNADPIEVCFVPDQYLNANPAITLLNGNGNISNVFIGYESCSGPPAYCVYYENETINETVKIQVEETDPVIPGYLGSAFAEFQVNTDHERATSFCVYDDEGGQGFIQDNNCGIAKFIDVVAHADALTNLNPGCNIVRIAEIDPASLPSPPTGSVTMLYDIIPPEGSEIAAGRTVTIMMGFEVIDGSTRPDYDSGLKNFEILYYDDGTNPGPGSGWKSDGITFDYYDDVHWYSDTTGTAIFETGHFSVFTASSKNIDSDNGNNIQALGSDGGGGGCSLTSYQKSTGTIGINLLILFMLPLIIFRIWQH